MHSMQSPPRLAPWRLWVLLFALLTASTRSVTAVEFKTLKERLSDKASDEQRVDNCRVPRERRGVKPRPDCSLKGGSLGVVR